MYHHHFITPKRPVYFPKMSEAGISANIEYGKQGQKVP